MSNYTPVTNFLSKDSLVSGNALKALKGAELSTEFAAVATAVNSKPDGSAQFFPDGSATQPSVGFTNNAGTGMYQSGGTLEFATGATLRLSIAASGAITAASLVSANAGLTVAGGVFTSRGIADNATANALTVSSSGNVTVVAPASGSALAVNGVAAANVSTLTVQGSSTAGQSNGLFILAGNGSANDRVLDILSYNSSARLFGVFGDGSIITSGQAQLGAGQINAAGLNVAGNPVYAGVPQTGVSSNYTTVLSDANKHIRTSAASITVTIAANASVPYPIGTAITFVAGGGAISIALAGGDTLVISGTSTTGTRALAGNGVATALKTSATVWFISGPGLT